jgi:dipeptidyl aminopeptidase/acylaminoacyl peptidase
LAANVNTTAYAMPIYQNVAIDSRDGVRLAAWWIPADRPNAPVVVMAHGAGSCRRDPVMLLPAGMLHRNGFAVLMVDSALAGRSASLHA